MDVENKALKDNGIWSYTSLLLGKKPIGCKLVYEIKYHSYGTIEHYKALLVAKGYNKLRE